MEMSSIECKGRKEQTTQTSTAPLLRRVVMFLEDGDWQRADEYCEKVLDLDPENAEAYLGKMMAELHVRTREALKDQPEPFDNQGNYQKVLRFGDEKLKQKLIADVAFIKDRNETARKEGIYQSACSQMTGYAVSNYESAIKSFLTIPGWKDAEDLILACQRRIKEIKAKEEADRLEYERKARIAKERAAKKRKKTISIVMSIVVICIAFIIVLKTIIIPNQKYKAAIELYNVGKYEDAIIAFTVLDGYKDSTTQIEKCKTAVKPEKYANAVELYNAGKYEEAITEFNALDGYKDSVAKISEIKPKYYKQLLSNASVGSTVYFGSYEQDNITSNGKEDIEWIVLAKEGDRALVISKYALDFQPYNSSDENVTWETCSLRNWLNETFLNTAFNYLEQNSIISSTVIAHRNPSWMTSPGNNTMDKVFLLSITEANKYFSSDEARKCTPTDYAIAKGVKAFNSDFTGGKTTCFWTLRSPGFDSNAAAFVISDGSVYNNGGIVKVGNGIRPALWITIE